MAARGDVSSGSGRVGGRVATFLGLLVLYSLATAFFFWSWIPHVHSALIGPPEDNMQDFWSTYYVAVTRDQNFFFTNLLRFPEGYRGPDVTVLRVY